jgi:cation diffusion facilitator family transporter
MDPNRKKRNAALLSVGSNVALVAAKLAVGYSIGSVSIVSEGIHSAVDLFAALIALLAVHAASKPPDEQHPFGHGKIENLSGTLEAALIGVAGIWIIVEAGQRLLHGGSVSQPILGLVVMALSSCVNYGVSRYLLRVAKETQSVALEADAWHLRTDVWTSLGVTAGFVAVTIARFALPRLDLAWLDPVTAMMVALLIIKAAWELTQHALGDLLDASVPASERIMIENLIKTHPEVLGAHGIRARKSGAMRFIELHMVVPPETTVAQSHELQHAVAQKMRELWGNVSLIAHVEPCDRRCPNRCREGCWVTPNPNAAAPRPDESRDSI